MNITIEALYERYAAQIHVYLNRYVRDIDVADDLTQVVFTKAWRALPCLVPGSSVQAWLYKIAQNAALDELRAKKGQKYGALPGHYPIEDNLEAMVVVDEDETLFVQQQVRQALSVLSAKEQRALLLFYVYGLSIRELAQYDQTSESAIKARLKRAREHFIQVYSRMQEEKEGGAAA